jgi:polyketide synthase PksN
LTDAEGQKIPRRAGVSSFGFGGANAHLVLEEYDSKLPTRADDVPQLLVLSAKNAERLQAYVKLMRDFLAKTTDICYLNLAYTLQVGREAMAERLAIVADSVEALTNKFTQYLNGQTEIADLYRGFVNSRSQAGLFAGEAGEAFLKILRLDRYSKLIKSSKLISLTQSRKAAKERKDLKLW